MKASFGRQIGWTIGIGLLLMSNSSFGQSGVTGSYQVDRAHSSVAFRVKHLRVGFVLGRFNRIGGAFRINEEQPQNSAFDIRIAATSVDTGVAQRDQHLRGPDFLNVRQFPWIRFKSSNVKKLDEETYQVTGNLTLHGVTRPMSIDVELVGHGERGPQFGYRAGLLAEFSIQRSRFGMRYWLENGLVGDTVRLTVALEGRRQEDRVNP